MTTTATRPRRAPRAAAAALSAALLLTAACEGGPGGAGGGPFANASAASVGPLTPQQQALREQSSRWNQTAFTGALVGAAAGAGLGAATGGRNRGEAALAGALLGGVIGLIGGSAVADRNLGFENRELSAGQRVQDARQVAQNLEATAASSEQVAAQNRRRLDDLDRQYRAGRITAAQYNRDAASMRQDAELMRKTAAEAREAREKLLASSRQVPQLLGEEGKIDQAQRRLEASASDLETALRRVPTG